MGSGKLWKEMSEKKKRALRSYINNGARRGVSEKRGWQEMA